MDQRIKIAGDDEKLLVYFWLIEANHRLSLVLDKSLLAYDERKEPSSMIYQTHFLSIIKFNIELLLKISLKDYRKTLSEKEYLRSNEGSIAS